MADKAAVKAYHRRKNVVRLVGLALGLAYALAWCWVAPAWTRWLAGVVGYRWLVLPIVGGSMLLVQEILLLPMSFYSGYVLEHRYDLSNENVPKWVIRELKELGLGAVLGGVLLAGLYGLLWYGGSLWWLWAWFGWLFLAVVLTRLFPVLILPIFYQATPLEDESLVDRLRRLAEGAGLRISGVFRLGLSEETKKPNAMLTGLGSTRRVLLSDTLLDAFEPDEIETVFVHELGHHRRGHIHKGIAMSAVAATLVIGAIVWRLGPYAGSDAGNWQRAIAALPQVLLVMLGIGLVLQPVVNAIMRRFETQCDQDALDATGAETYRSAFEKLAEMSMADPEPSRIIEVFFYDHPPIGKRLALAGAPSGDSAGES
ncbi:MAG: M48 family metallopeptidase [Phycisphaerae bacterium]|nr:M48 family metallopeptidase [Phycisphaerae bacterium]